jgi:ABC-type multidrug transport system ATPase subunit
MLQLQNLGKKYNRSWIFKELNETFTVGDCIQITGNNGAGKSTLIKILAGIETPTEGSITHQNNKGVKHMDVSFCAPYQGLYTELTLQELFNLTQRFRPLLINDFESFVVAMDYPRKKLLNKPIQKYSSGMQQRVKVLLACCMKSEILLLDEPASNLDAQGVSWYVKTVQKFSKNRIVFVATNDTEREASFCTKRIEMRA